MTSYRIINLGIFVVCSLFIAIAHYMQYVMYLDPCPLCMVQRAALIAIGLTCLVAFVHNPAGRGKIAYSLAMMVFSLFGSAIAGRHVWLQSLPADSVPECFPGIGFILANNPLLEAIQIILGGTGECAETQWSFLSLSIPGWTLVLFAAFVILAILQLINLGKTPMVPTKA